VIRRGRSGARPQPRPLLRRAPRPALPCSALRLPAPPLLALLLPALLLCACNSNPFNTAGSGLPIDVQQDHLAVPDSVVGTVQEMKVIPAASQLLIDREVLYLGTQRSAGWRATPLVRFNFAAVPDTVHVFAYRWLRVSLELKILASDLGRGARTVALYALRDTLNAGLADSTLAAVLGDSLAIARDLPGSADFRIPLDSTRVASWIQARGHMGLALVDRTDTPDTNIVGLASKQLTHFSLLLPEQALEVVAPEIVIELGDPNLTFRAYPAIDDLTHFVRPADPPVDPGLALGSHLPARVWLRFDLSAIDPTSTINRALLVLPIDRSRTVGTANAAMAAYRSTLANAGVADATTLEAVLNSASSVDLRAAVRVRVNVTEFVQRKVNGVLQPDDGLLLALNSELLELGWAGLFGTNASDPALRPRIELLVTPPAHYRD
jgi:hypothetical protein